MLKTEMDKNKRGSALAKGSLDLIQSNLLYGWMYAASSLARPVVVVDRQPAQLLDSAVPRPDVCAALGISENAHPGFIFRLPSTRPESEIELWAITPDNCYMIAAKSAGKPCYEYNVLEQIAIAAKKAADPNAIAIVCADASLNGLARAIELYEIAAIAHPVVLFFSLANPRDPLRSPFPDGWAGCAVSIPTHLWPYADHLSKICDITFNTIWIAAANLASFKLAAFLARPGTHYLLDCSQDLTAKVAQHARVSRQWESSFIPFLCEQVAAQTVPDQALRDYTGATAVPHVIKPGRTLSPPENDGLIHIGFICQSQPANCDYANDLLTLSRAIRIIANATGLPLCLDIFTSSPDNESLQELKDTGANIHISSSANVVSEALSTIHVLIANLPCNDNELFPTPLLQALAAGKPVLAAAGQRTATLAQIPGVYLFNRDNFMDTLIAACGNREKINLPVEFTPAGAYRALKDALTRAKSAPLINALHDCGATTVVPSPAVVLFWKMADSGIYGRRIDQIARSIRRKFPDHRVIILELYDADWYGATDTQCQPTPYEEKQIIWQFLQQKKYGVEQDGIFYQALVLQPDINLKQEFEGWLLRNNLFPSNTLFILFPIIQHFHAITDSLRPYQSIVDIVDNEFAWCKNNCQKAEYMWQYFVTSILSSNIIFNSEINREYFIDTLKISPEKTCYIANWYNFPDNYHPYSSRINEGRTHLLYSGNMNDRVDWKAMITAATMPNATLHITGTADQKKDKLNTLIDCGAIYHGVLKERQTLDLLMHMDACIVAHIQDHVSKYMDPMKIKMYKKVGIPIIMPKWLSQCNEPLTYEEAHDCVRLIEQFMQDSQHTDPTDSSDACESAYMEMIERLHPALHHRSTNFRQQ